MRISATHERFAVLSLRRIVFARWFLIIVFAILGTVQQISYSSTSPISWAIWGSCIFLPLAYNVYYETVLRRPLSAVHIRNLSIAQVVTDVILFSWITYVTGAAESVGFLLYIFAILEATLLLTNLFVIATSVFAVGGYMSVMILDAYRIIPHVSRFEESSILKNQYAIASNTFSVSLLLLLIGFFAVVINRFIEERTAQLIIEQDITKSLFQSLVDGVVLINGDRSVVLINPTAREFLDMPSNEPAVLDLHRFDPAYAQLVSVLREQTPHKVLDQQIVLEHKDQKLYLNIDSIPVRSKEGDIVYWLKVLHDMTRERQLEEVKSDFISTAAHQLRTPLAAIKWCVKMLLDGDAGDVNEQQRRLLRQAFERNEEVIETVNHLLNVSEIEEGRLQYVFTRTNAAKIIAEIVDDAEEDSARSGVHVRLSVGQDLPFIDVDVHKFRIAIQNLVDNAIKYSHTNARVDVRVAVRDNQYCIEVQDMGIGIPAEEQERVFMKFFRGGYAKEKETVGSGLGLYIVKNIITEHGGTIRFDSEQGKGTTFSITLPIPEYKKGTASLIE